LTTSGAQERLDTGKERKRRGLEEVEEGLEVLTADLIELRWLVRGDQTEVACFCAQEQRREEPGMARLVW
jgi:hypothetical protein